MIRSFAFALILTTPAVLTPAVLTPAYAKLRIIGLPKVGDGPAIMRSVVDMTLTTMVAGDETLVMNAPDGKLVADVKLFEDPLMNRLERKAEAIAPALHAVKAYTDAMTPVSDDAPATLNASGLLDAIGPILAAHPGKSADILLWGSASFSAPHALMGKDYRGTFPSDGLISGDRASSPFGTRGLRDLEGSSVWYCHTEAAADFVSQEHEQRVERAWALLIGLRGGRLVAFSGDQKSCLDRFKKDAVDPIAFSLDPDDIKIQKMERPQDIAPKIMDEAPIKPRAPITRAPSPERSGEAARFDQPGRTSPPRTRQGVAWMGIKWPDPIDLDIYVRCRSDMPFLFFGHQLTAEGRHNFDYREGTGDAFETVDLTSPCADISKAEVFVNFYSGTTSAPPAGVFAIQFDGGIYKIPFQLEATEGNRGGMSFLGGMNGPDWVKIDLPAVLHLNQGGVSQGGTLRATPIPMGSAKMVHAGKLAN